MHEASIVRSIARTVMDTIERQHVQGRVSKVFVTAGVCQGLVPESMRFFFEIEREGTALADAELVVQMQPMVARCRSCLDEREIAIPILICPKCGSEMDLIKGRELLVTSIEVDQ